MRIISGKHKGKILRAPKNLPTRPTTNKAKEGLFNILQHQYEFKGLLVLDLFAGIGSFSYECLSRAASAVTCVDSNAGCIKYLKNTAAILGEKITVVQKDAYIFLNNDQQNYHLIFADPPYDFSKEKLLNLINLVFNRDLLDESIGMLILEHIENFSFDNHPRFTASRRYGMNIFSFFE